MISPTKDLTEKRDLLLKPRLDMDGLVKTKIPPLQGTILRLTELLRDINVSSKELADTVGCDPILAARILKLANSSFYARRKAVTTIQHAIESVGTKALYDMVMLGAMSDSFGKEIRDSVLGRTVWEHSLAVGILARELSRVLQLRGAEEAFLCGLLHDIGKILMLRSDSERFESLLDKRTELEMFEWEQRIYGFDHTEVGAYVTYKWGLPESIYNVIMHHHHPSKTQTSTVVANVVNAADLITNINGYGLRLADEGEIFDCESVNFLGLTREQMFEAWDTIQEPLEEIIWAFN
ncbi:MAG TPA: HDOD domain-containing protein [Pyrinomonadaceae bacterium]|nr:HDOD domain-containing protein [Pyrinomonadaceae bacterium]